MKTIKDHLINEFTNCGYFGAVNGFYNAFPKVKNIRILKLLYTEYTEDWTIDCDSTFFAYDYELNPYNLTKEENTIIDYIKLCMKMDGNLPIWINPWKEKSKWKKIKDFFSQNIF